MAEWWHSIPVFEKIFWYFAVPFTIILSFQLVLTFIGIDWHDGDLDAAEGNTDFLTGFHLFTLRNFIIFFTGFGWAGIFSVHAGFNQVVTVFFAFFIGLILMFAVAVMFYLVTKLTQISNISLTNAMNSIGRVYLPIPGNRSGVGQVQLTVQGSIREVQAMTDEETLSTGTPVTVMEIVNDEILVVKKSQ